MMRTIRFVGRQEELRDLKQLQSKKTASLAVIQGRRRIGKSRLVSEFAKECTFFSFSGIVPTVKTTAQSQRDEFSSQLAKHGFPKLKAEDWNDLFWLLASKTRTGRVVILFDEISWMGFKDPDFLGKLKNAWDLHFKDNPELMLILCGSVSAWIEKNILGNTGFMGRISRTLTLKELNLKECNQFLAELGSPAAAYEKFKILSVTGGVPRYLEEVQPSLSAEENIRQLCFSPKGILFQEFDSIFSDLFSKRSEIYKKIIEVFAIGSVEYNELCQKLHTQKSGRLSEYLDDLLKSGFISRDYSWHLRTGQESRLSHYRLSDNYLRFYLKYIQKNRGKIEQWHFENKSFLSLPGLESILGLQFENLVLSNRRSVWEKLKIRPEEIVSDNPFFQRKTVKMPGCKIDYLIQTRFNTLYVCEIKFSKHEIGPSVIEEVKQKIDRLKIPRGFSCRPILIHVNGVTDKLLERDFFAGIINFSELL